MAEIIGFMKVYLTMKRNRNMQSDIEKNLLTTLGILQRASARKKIYSQKAKKEGRKEIGLLLRAISTSEAIQARRILNLIKGQIDLSGDYLNTVFEQDIDSLLDRYIQDIEEVTQAGIPSIPQALTQLRAAERRIKSFYSKKTKDVRIKEDETLYVCNFCGYISVDNIPTSCPICSAEKKAFKQIE